MKTVSFEDGHMPEGAFHHGFRRGTAKACQQLLFKGAAIDPDADGKLPVPGRIHHGLHLLLASDVSRIDPEGVHPVLRGLEGQSVIEVDVGHKGNGNGLPDFADGNGSRHVGNGHAHDVASGLLQALDLGDGGPNVIGPGIGHGLDGNRGIATNGHVPDPDLTGRFAWSGNRHHYLLWMEWERTGFRPPSRNGKPRQTAGFRVCILKVNTKGPSLPQADVSLPFPCRKSKHSL